MLWNSTTRELAIMIEKVADTGFSCNENDVAIKTYFFPLAGALFTSAEWASFMEKDDLTIKHNKLGWVQKELGLRLKAILARLYDGTAPANLISPEERPIKPQYISIIVYGMNTKRTAVSMVYNYSPELTYEVSKIVPA